MTFEIIHEYCLSLPGVWEDMPFDENSLVFKVGTKMFALLAINEEPLRINLKCEPEKAIELRERFPMNVLPGYHMSKKHWNTVLLDYNLKWTTVKEWIDNSYTLVFNKLSKKEQAEING